MHGCREPKDIVIFSLFQDEGFKLNRYQYYQEGWLSVASLRGLVGVTYTTSHCSTSGNGSPEVPLPYAGDQGPPPVPGSVGPDEPPKRTNYNMRGHRAAVGKNKFFLVYQLRTVQRNTKMLCILFQECFFDKFGS